MVTLLGGLLAGGSGAATGNRSPTEGEAMFRFFRLDLDFYFSVL